MCRVDSWWLEEVFGMILRLASTVKIAAADDAYVWDGKYIS
jgi:hypothetical protein